MDYARGLGPAFFYSNFFIYRRRFTVPALLKTDWSSVGKNLFLLTIGAVLVAIAVKGIFMPHSFLSGGIFGLSLYIYYAFDWLSPGSWYAIMSIPISLVAWRFVSLRFCLYSLYATLLASLLTEVVPWYIPVNDSLLAAVAGGVIMGAGVGFTLRSQGSDGGLTIIAIALHQRYNVRIGHISLVFNAALFTLALGTLQLDHILYSMIAIFVSSAVMDYFVSMFNERKMAMIISNHPDEIAKRLMEVLGRGVTFISGKGGYTKKDKLLVLTVVHNYQLKRLEETVYAADPNAFVIVENTFNVLGSGFSKRKVY